MAMPLVFMDTHLAMDQMNDFVEGYIDGLMNIYIRDQLDDCNVFAEDT